MRKWEKIFTKNKIYYKDDYQKLWEQSKDSLRTIEAEGNIYQRIIFKEFSLEEYEEYRDYIIDKELGDKKWAKQE